MMSRVMGDVCYEISAPSESCVWRSKDQHMQYTMRGSMIRDLSHREWYE